MDQPQVQLLHDTFFDFIPEEIADNSLTVAQIHSLEHRIQPAPILRIAKDELHDASVLHRELRPALLPQARSATIHAWCRSKGVVGGDLYDVFRVNESQLGFWIVDATGHRLSSALLASVARGVLGTYARQVRRLGIYDPKEALQLLNEEVLHHHFSDCSFVAAVCGTYDEHSRTVRWVRAGTPAPLLFKRSQAARRIHSDGTAVGMIDDPALNEVKHQLESDEIISFFTDGLDDAPFDWARMLRDYSTFERRDRSSKDSHTGRPDLNLVDDALRGEMMASDASDDITSITFFAH